MIDEKNVSAFILGVRKGDPYCEGMEEVCESSKDWPRFVRVNPILDWSYGDVWLFLRWFELPYCELYDRGFTSVGNQADSRENPMLVSGGVSLPAWMLEDESLERAGRDCKNIK